MLTTATDRFELRLTQESALVRKEMHEGLGVIRADLASVRVEILRWSFAFWIGQLAAIGALIALMLRTLGR